MKHLVSDDAGNINLDFLVGLLVFMMAFLYVVVTIPGVFLPYQSNSVDLGSVVYRTSAILAEDPGWWSNQANPLALQNGTDWEDGDHQPFLARVGLANDKVHPNLLSIKKISMLKNMPYDQVRTNLSLGDFNDMTKNTVVYNFTLSINMTNSTGSSYNILKIPSPGDPAASVIGYNLGSATVIESIDRIVLIDEGDMIDLSNYVPGEHDSTTLDVNGTNISVSGFRDNTNITVRISNFSGAFSDGNFVNFNFSFFHNSNIILDTPDVMTADQCFIYNMLNIHVQNQSSDYWLSSINDFYYDDPKNVIDFVLNGTRVAEILYHYDLADPAYYDYANKFYYFRITTSGAPAVAFPGTGVGYVDYSASDPNNKYYRHNFMNGVMTLQVWQA